MPGDWEPETGNFLGDLTSELSCSKLKCQEECTGDHYIVKFVCGGPKNYGYVTEQGKSFVKIRGFTLSTATAEQKLTVEAMERQVVRFVEQTAKNTVFQRVEKTSPRRDEETAEEYENRTNMIIVSSGSFKRDKTKMTVANTKLTKRYSCNYTKRAVKGLSFLTVPWGWKDI